MTSRPNRPGGHGPAGAGAPSAERVVAAPNKPRSEATQRWRLVLARRPLEGGAPQKAWLASLAAALVEGGLPVSGLDAEPPRPRVTLGAPLPSGVPGERELVDVHLARREPAWRVREVVRGALDDGDALVDCHDVWLGEPPLPGRVTGAVYRTEFRAEPGDPRLATRLLEAATAMVEAPTLPRARRKGEATVSYDLRPFLVGATVDATPGHGATLRCVLRHDPERGVGRPEEVLGELEDRIGHRLEGSGPVRERLLLADELPPRQAEPAPGRGRPPMPRARSRPGGR